MSIVTCFTIITSLSIFGRPYVDFKTLIDNMGNTNYKLLYGIIGANIATIANELLN